MNPLQHPKLSYYLAEKHSVLIVTWVGPWVRANAAVFEEASQAILSSKASWVILNCRDVPPLMDRTLEPPLARLQKALREGKKEVRVASLHPDLRKILIERGIVRVQEIHDNLASALMEISGGAKDAA